MEDGDSHVCSSSPDNLIKLIKSAPEGVRQKVLARLLRDEAAGAKELSISSGGRPVTVTLGGPKTIPTPQISGQTMMEMQTELGLSDKALLGVAKFIRKDLGRSAIESCLPAFAKEQSHSLDDVYNVKMKRFILSTDGRGNPMEWGMRPFVFAPISQIVPLINAKRENNPEKTLTKVMLDGGKGFFKVSLSLIPFDIERPSQDECKGSEASSDEECEGSEARVAGGCRNRQRKTSAITGVNRLILLAVVPNIPEHRRNLEIIFQEIGLDEERVVFSGDMKIYSPLLGLQGYSAAFPCPYCDVPRDRLDSIGTPRSFGDLRRWNNEFEMAGGDKSKCKLFFNCLHRPIMEIYDDDDLVLLVLPPPQLHLMLGAVNTLFAALEKVWGSDKVNEWARLVGVCKEAYHGGQFDGNECRKLLRPESLKKLTALAQGHQGVLAYVEAFEALNAIIKECFGMYFNPRTDHQALVDSFHRKFAALGIRFTPKIHVITHHVVEFMGAVEDSLGLFSEQAGETVHSKFDKMWKLRFKIRDLNHPNYPKSLLRAVGEFSSKRI